jgi:hypothetical protein
MVRVKKTRRNKGDPPPKPNACAQEGRQPGKRLQDHAGRIQISIPVILFARFVIQITSFSEQ